MHISSPVHSILLLIVLLLLLPLACVPARETGDILPAACLTEDYLPLMKGKRVGVVVNQTSLIRDVNLVDTLLERGVEIYRIFSPEHGFKGRADAGESVSDDSYGIQEIPLISLYGDRRKPRAEDMQDLDIMVFDLQDVGVRFYTYISTLHYVMEACAENGISLVVLDRPNPNGHYVDGPMLDPAFRSFVGMHPVPVVHGMTIGEYARMINGEFWLADSLQCDLQVIACKNYDHTLFYELPAWPSPNLQSMEAIYLYPSTGFFEGTVVSEGRGTDAPFRLMGHPDYSQKSIQFTPRSIPGASLNPKFRGVTCFGIDLRSLETDSLQRLKSIRLEYLLNFYSDLKKGEDFFTGYIDLLAGSDSLRKQILQGMPAETIRDSWQEDISEFKKIRAKYLLYPDFE